jgi:spore coat protein U-like protein
MSGARIDTAASRLTATLLMVVLVGWARQGDAETGKSFQVSADIVKGCLVTVDGAGQWGRIDFGTVSGMAQGTVDADLLSGATSGIQIDCTPNTNASLTADNGDHASNGVRQMGLNGSNSPAIHYQLFADGSSTPWTTQAIPLAFPAGTSHRVLPVLGRATLNRPMAAGTYTDTVRVTLTW